MLYSKFLEAIGVILLVSGLFIPNLATAETLLITDVRISVGGTSSQPIATVIWKTNYPSSSRVLYGVSSDLSTSSSGTGGSTILESNTPCPNTPSGPVLDHCVVFSGLYAGATYYLKTVSEANGMVSYSPVLQFVAKPLIVGTNSTDPNLSTTSNSGSTTTSSNTTSSGLTTTTTTLPTSTLTSPLTSTTTSNLTTTQSPAGTTASSTYSLGKLVVYAKDSTGKVLSGVGVAVDDYSSGPGGGFSFEAQYLKTSTNGTANFDLPAGQFVIRGSIAQESGLLNPPENIVSIVLGQTQYVVLVFASIVQSQPVNIFGNVRLEDGSLVPFAKVWAVSSEGGFIQATTSSKGDYSLQLPRNKQWRVGAAGNVNGYLYRAAERYVNFDFASQALILILVQESTAPLSQPVTIQKPITQTVEVSTQDGAGLSIPPGAVTGTTQVTVSINPTASIASQASSQVVGSGYDIKINSLEGQSITNTNNFVTITLPFDDTVLQKRGIGAGQLKPSYFDETTGAWVNIDNFTVDYSRHVILAQVKHFTIFALVAPADTIRPEPPSSLVVWESSPLVVSLEWLDPIVDFHHAKVYRSEVSGDLGKLINDAVTSGILDDTSVISGTTYFYSVKSVDAAGNESGTAQTASVAVSGQAQVKPVNLADAHPNGTLILDGKTVFLIKNSKRVGFRDPAEYASYGYNFGQVVAANDEDKKLPLDTIVLKALEGTLAIDASDGRTVYMVGVGGTKRGFVSSTVFVQLGYSFKDLPRINLSDYAAGAPISDGAGAHPEGALVVSGQTVFWVRNGVRQGFETLEVFNTYGFQVTKIVKANSSDLAMPEGLLVKFRDGTVILDDGAYYIISDGRKLSFADENSLTSFGYKKGNAVKADVDKYQNGKAVGKK